MALLVFPWGALVKINITISMPNQSVCNALFIKLVLHDNDFSSCSNFYIIHWHEEVFALA